MSQARTKHRRAHDPRRRYERLARQWIIHGKRLAGCDEDFIGGIHRPLTMNEADLAASYEWARQTPNRWWVRAIVYCVDEDGNQYNEQMQAEIQQAVRVNETSEYRLSLLDQARASVNARHVVAEGFEMGVI